MNEYTIALTSVLFFMLGGGMTFFVMKSIRNDPTNIGVNDILSSIYEREALFIKEINSLKSFAEDSTRTIHQLKALLEANGLPHNHVTLPNYEPSPQLTFNIRAGGNVDIADIAGGSNRGRESNQTTSVESSDGKPVSMNILDPPP